MVLTETQKKVNRRIAKLKYEATEKGQFSRRLGKEYENYKNRNKRLYNKVMRQLLKEAHKQ